MSENELKAPSADELRAKVFAKAIENGADPAALLKSQADALSGLIDSTANAIGGDERELAHLEAQFKLGKFSAEAEAFAEARAWIDAIREVLVEVAAMGLQAAAQAAAHALVSSLKEGFGE